MNITSVVDYAELHCLSNFSFLRAASHPQELLQQAHTLGYKALALTDECSVAGVVRAYQYKKEHSLNIKLIIGSEFLLKPDQLEAQESIVVLAKTAKAMPSYANSLALLGSGVKRVGIKLISMTLKNLVSAYLYGTLIQIALVS